MKKTILILATLFGFAALLPAQGMDEDMMKAWQESMTPNENHAWMAQLEGNWTYTNTNYMDPSGQPTTSNGKTVMQMVCQGRYLQGHHTGTSFGMPFEGHSTMGYDNISKEFIGNWIDNMGTGFMRSKGTLEGNTLTENATYVNMEGGEDRMKMVTTIKNKNEHSMVMYMYDPDGNEIKMMEIDYKRVK